MHGVDQAPSSQHRDARRRDRGAGGSPPFAFDGRFDTGAYASWGPTVATRVPIHASGPYADFANYRAEATGYYTNGPVAGAFRGFGVPQAAIAQETLYRPARRRHRHGSLWISACETRSINDVPDRDGPDSSKTASASRLAWEALRPHWIRRLRERADGATMPDPGKSSRAGCWPRLLLVWLWEHQPCPIPRPSSSVCIATGMWCCSRALLTSGRAPTP